MSIHLSVLKSSANACDIDTQAMADQGVCVALVDAEKLDTVTDAMCDVVLLLDGTEGDTLDRIARVQAVAPRCKLIVRTGQSCLYAVSCLQAGVHGILDALPDAVLLAEIVRQVYEDRYYLDTQVAQLLAIRHIKKLLEPFNTLSSREFDVFCMLAEGCSLQTVSGRLGVSSKTVSNCQALIKTKLGLESREDLVYFAKKHGLIS